VVVAERVRLWDTIDTWMARQRVKQADIIKHGGVARNTLWLIQQGTTTEPEAETIRKIARGLAADPRTGELDRPVYLEALRELCSVANLPDLTDEIPPCDLESEIRAVVGDQRRARVLAAFIHRYPNMSSGDRKLIDSVLDNLGHTG
jgi:transcriptional regulator with XRE-family HTH domain